jgi:CheY-like chemotaxis protein
MLRVRKLLSATNPVRSAQLELVVSDTGEGIAADFLPHVFERFRQADMGDTRAHAGLGIGLALTRQLVELQGGTIDVQSEGRGRGASFCARIPWFDCDGSAEPLDDDEAPDKSFSGPLAGLNVLVVEDDGNTREAMQWILVRAGARVVSVSSAMEALRVFGLSATGEQVEPAQPTDPLPDIVVSDLGLPGMSGYELIEQIAEACRARGLRAPPACAVSAHAREIDRQRAIEAGFDLHMGKPVTPEKLIEAVQDLRDIAATP